MPRHVLHLKGHVEVVSGWRQTKKTTNCTTRTVQSQSDAIIINVRSGDSGSVDGGDGGGGGGGGGVGHCHRFPSRFVGDK